MVKLQRYGLMLSPWHLLSRASLAVKTNPKLTELPDLVEYRRRCSSMPDFLTLSICFEKVLSSCADHGTEHDGFLADFEMRWRNIALLLLALNGSVSWSVRLVHVLRFEAAEIILFLCWSAYFSGHRCPPLPLIPEINLEVE